MPFQRSSFSRMGFAHFAGSDSNFAGSIRRRTGEPILDVIRVTAHAVSLMLGIRCGTTEGTAVVMKTHNGARPVSYIARPVGNGPFGVVLQRTPYTRILHPAGRYWASRGYIFVAQHVRGRAARRERPGRNDRPLRRRPAGVVRRGDDNHREGEGAGAADLRMVRRLARTDRLHQRAEHGAGTSVHPARDGTGAHKGVDYVASEFGPQSRVDTRRLQLRWFDHYLFGKDNGDSRELETPIEVAGQMSATLWAATDATDTDWSVMLLDIFPDGHSHSRCMRRATGCTDRRSVRCWRWTESGSGWLVAQELRRGNNARRPPFS